MKYLKRYQKDPEGMTETKRLESVDDGESNEDEVERVKVKWIAAWSVVLRCYLPKKKLKKEKLLSIY
jgi:hypothetical protein